MGIIMNQWILTHLLWCCGCYYYHDYYWGNAHITRICPVGGHAAGLRDLFHTSPVLCGSSFAFQHNRKFQDLFYVSCPGLEISIYPETRGFS